MSADRTIPKEGDLFATIVAHGHTFQLRYGYYEESDRVLQEPVVLYPDLKTDPVFSPDGRPLVTAVQAPCEHYAVAGNGDSEGCCGDCIYYPNVREEISLCYCERRRRDISPDGKIL